MGKIHLKQKGCDILMKVIIYFLFSIFSFCVFLKSEHTIFAKQQEKHKSFEEGFFEIGYKSLKEAHEDFEGHFNQELKLPLKVPPVEFTHYFGRFSDLDEEINDSFDVEFISETSPENHYKIDVRPIKYKIPIENKSVVKIFKLQNGNDAWYTETSGFNVLVVSPNYKK